jgi:hypothetical protein
MWWWVGGGVILAAGLLWALAPMFDGWRRR